MDTASRIVRAPRGSTLHVQGLAAGSGAADADEQPRPGGRRASAGPRRLRRLGPRGAQLARVRRDRRVAARARRRRDAARAVGEAGRRVPHASRARRACSSPTRCVVPAWATLENFRDLEDRGLTMYGQMTAGSWIYIGTQGILQGTYETLAAVGRRHFGGSLAGRLFVTAGLGGMGGAQPLAATMNGGVALSVEVDPARIERRLATRYVDEAPIRSMRRWSASRAGRRGEDRALDRALRQRGRRAAGTRRARRDARRPDRPDLGARSAERLRAERSDARRGGGTARPRCGGVHCAAPCRPWRGTCARCWRSSGAAR